MLKRPFGCEVQTALCFVHRPQEQARTGITDPQVGHSKVNRKLPQWQLPSIFSLEIGSGTGNGSSDSEIFGNDKNSTRAIQYHTFGNIINDDWLHV